MNGEFYNNLSDEIKSSLVSTEICNDPSKNSENGGDHSVGGYTKQELSSTGETCITSYSNDKVRLISNSEYNNLSQIIESENYPKEYGLGSKIPRINYITRMESNDWLYSSSIGNWWTMTASESYRDTSAYRYVHPVVTYGSSFNGVTGSEVLSTNIYGVRPVIVLQK